MNVPGTYEEMRALAVALLIKMGGQADLTFEEYGEGVIAAKFNGVTVSAEGAPRGVHVSVVPASRAAVAQPGESP